MIRKIIFYSLIFIQTIAFGQDVHFSQFSQTPQLINPGATGVFNGSFRGIINYKTHLKIQETFSNGRNICR